MPFQERKPFLYRLVRGVMRIALGVFFQKIEVRHPENVPQASPVVFVANHPNSIMDALVLGVVTTRKINYIAHAGLFKNRFMNWFLRSCGVIPVHRRQDDPDKMGQNVEAFAACYEVLERGETIGIFPEGTSDMARRVHKLKTGAARITLETAARNNYELDLQVIPIGLHFFSRSHFRSRVLVNFGRPIDLKGFYEEYQRDPVSAVRELTAEIQRHLERLTVNVRSDELDAFVRDVERIYADELRSYDSTLRKSPEASVAEFVISQKIAECVQFYQEHAPERLEKMQDWIRAYNRKLKRLHLRDAMLREKTTTGTLWRQSLKVLGIGLLGFPLAAYGAVNNYIPYRIAEAMGRHFLYERTKILSALLIGGGLAFLFFYTVQTTAAVLLFGPLVGIAYLVSLPTSGFFTLAFTKQMREHQQKVSFSFFLFTNKHLIRKMRLERRRLIDALNQVRDDYLALSSGSGDGKSAGEVSERSPEEARR
jgi:1-acyl-sn-glycerol-3-phosphate acyltransferase